MKAISAVLLALVLGACASTPPPAADSGRALSGAWRFTVEDGLATATLTGASGPLAVISCQAPRGPVVIADYSFADVRDPAPTARFRLGGVESLAPARISAFNGAQGLVVFIAPSDAVFQTITATAPVSVGIIGGASATWPAGSAMQVNAVLNACISRGS